MTKRGYLWFFIWALSTTVLGVALWWACLPRPIGEPIPATPAQVPALAFRDITRTSAISFVHKNGARGDKLLPETMAGGGAFLDYDGDGLQDIYLVQSGPWQEEKTKQSKVGGCALWRNLGNGKFAEVPHAAGAALVGFFGMGVAVGDFDNDGWPDLAVSGLGGVRLLRNVPLEKGRAFVEKVTGLPYSPLPDLPYPEFVRQTKPIPFATSLTWIDYDLDGRLDLAWGEYLTWSPAMDIAADARLSGTGLKAYAPPTAFPGARVQLWRNEGNGTFTDHGTDGGLVVRESRDDRSGGVLVGKTLGILALDVDEDGWPDLLASNDMARNFLFQNLPGPDGKRHFVERGLEAGFAYAEGTPRAGMGMDEAQIGPNKRAVVVVNYAGEPDSLYEIGSQKGNLRLVDRARAWGIGLASRDPLKFGALFLDLDLDGHCDLFTTSGHLEPDISKVRPEQSLAQSAQAFWNAGDGNFVPWGREALGVDYFTTMVGRGSATADLDGNGRPGLLSLANDGPPRLLWAELSRNQWIRLTLVGDGVRVNSDAQGALVFVETAGQVTCHRVGGGRSYLSQSEMSLTIGLGNAQKVDRVRVRFPGKEIKEQVWTDLIANRSHVLKMK